MRHPCASVHHSDVAASVAVAQAGARPRGPVRWLLFPALPGPAPQNSFPGTLTLGFFDFPGVLWGLSCSMDHAVLEARAPEQLI